MYGGSHYIASADGTSQGKAIVEAAVKFGDGKTLPFPPCKRYYNPYGMLDGRREKMYGCRLHHEARKRRVESEGGNWRGGEKRLSDFWNDNNDTGCKDLEKINKHEFKKRAKKRK